MPAEPSGAGTPSGSRLIAPVAVALIAVMTVAAVVLTQRLRREGTVFSGTTVRALDRDDRREPGRNLKICFRLTREDTLNVTLTTPRGEPVRTLADGVRLAGDERHCFRWDGTGEDGAELAAGRYRLRIALQEAGRTAVAGERVVLAEPEPAEEDQGVG